MFLSAAPFPHIQRVAPPPRVANHAPQAQARHGQTLRTGQLTPEPLPPLTPEMSREYGAQHQHPDALDRIIDELQEIIDYLEIQLKQEELPTPSVKKNSTQLTLRVQQRDRRNNRETPLQKLQKMITTKKALLEEWKKVQQELFPAISKAVK